MYVGLFDQDLLISPNTFVPSLELMQYSSYYKREGNVVKMFYNANETDPFDKIILSSNVKSKSFLPKLMMMNPKVEWIGTAFYGAHHRPPKEIEICESDATIYEAFYEKNKMKFSNKQRERLGKFLDGAHYRFTHQGEIIFDYKKVMKEDRKIYLYDENIFSCSDVFWDLKNFNAPAGIVFLNPQRVENFDDFLKAKRDMQKLYSYHSNAPAIVYDGELEKKDFVNNQTIFSSVYAIGIPNQKKDNESWSDFGFRHFISKGNFYFYSIAQGRKIFIHKNPNIPSDSDGVKLFNHLCFFSRITTRSSNLTFFDFLLTRGSGINARELCKKYKSNPSLRRLFFANLNEVYKSGVWLL